MTTKTAALIALLAITVLAQVNSSQTPAAALKESLAQNQANLRAYSWIETTQISLKGEVRNEQEKQCYYGADGKVQKTPIGNKPAAEQQQAGGRRGGRLKQQIIENKIDDMKDYMERVVALVHEYVPPDPQKIQAAESAGNVSTQPSGGTLTLNVKNYNKPGDLLAIGFDTSAKLLSSYNVQSFVEKPKDDDVKLAVTFGRLQDGTSYPQQILLDVSAKQIQVKVTNSGYKKAGA